MPSMFCDVSVGPKESLEYHEEIVRSATCVKTRNPVWNESMTLKMSDRTVFGVDKDKIQKKSSKNKGLFKDGRFRGFMLVQFHDLNRIKLG